ncbi:SixA phosphatase family protein [Dermatobacter hominis]|uniref:SixA phosphatase family protein n=1 Tax=Dermatobacter hominis TaxID=2884263 RepID=UPI001D107FD8|nr:phosphoglycerate mutase family protein [Dermatobacter hominis]UDY37276.1 histidine phosphatase family protein [Dermatobacter hominis]
MTLYLVRHGSAGVRDDRDPHDADRPLDETGHLQAERLADWLRHESPTAVLSSPLLRCRQTVEPLAKVMGLDVVVEDDLAEGTSIDDAWGLVERLAGSSAVLCSHGDVIPEVISRAQRRGMVVPGKSGCAKGSVWTLRHWDGDTFATGIYTPVRV